MCVVCGCGDPALVLQSPAQAAAGASGTGTGAHADLHFGTGAARVSVPGMTQERAVKLETDVLSANQKVADQNRAHFEAHGVCALNLVSSPGSGKTTLLVATIEALRRAAPAVEIAVIEGDQQTSHDADRIRATGVAAIQVNTGKGCHLDAPMVAAAFARLPMHGHSHAHARDHEHEHAHEHEHGNDDHDHSHDPSHDYLHANLHVHAHVQPHDHSYDHGHNHVERLLFIENVGNLVCPALWDLGEAAKVVVLSVTEGEDKPLKYPDMFAAARLMVLTKTDLLPHVRFDVASCIAYARRVNPTIEVLQLSATRGEGMDGWLDWLLHEHSAAPAQAPAAAAGAAADSAEHLRHRVAELEAALAAANARVARVNTP